MTSQFIASCSSIRQNRTRPVYTINHFVRSRFIASCWSIRQNYTKPVYTINHLVTSRFIALCSNIRQNRTKPVPSLNTVIPWRTVTTPGAQPRVTCFCIDPLMNKYLKTRPRGSPLTNPLEQAAFLQLAVLRNARGWPSLLVRSLAHRVARALAWSCMQSVHSVG